MKIIYASDIHANPEHLFSILTIAENEEVNCIIIGDDIIPHYLSNTQKVGLLQAQEIYLRDIFIPTIKEFKKRSDALIYLDLANDDFIGNRYILENYDGKLLHLLHMRKHKLNDNVDIIGYMNVPPTPFNRKDWEKPDSVEIPFAKGNWIRLEGYTSYNGGLKETFINLASDDTIKKDLAHLSEIITGPFIFVSHSPPYFTHLDILDNGLHVGSISIKRFIEKWSNENQIIVSLHGHIHGSPKRSGSIHSFIGSTMCINPGQNEGLGSFLRYVILELTDH
jgi:Icc-related predicted phosphoesterase